MGATMLVTTDRDCDIISPELRRDYRFGKKALFSGQFYEIPKDSQGVRVQGTGDAAKYLRVPLADVGVRPATTDDVAAAIVAAREQKAAFAKGGVRAWWVEEAIAKADKVTKTNKEKEA